MGGVLDFWRKEVSDEGWGCWRKELLSYGGGEDTIDVKAGRKDYLIVNETYELKRRGEVKYNWCLFPSIFEIYIYRYTSIYFKRKFRIEINVQWCVICRKFCIKILCCSYKYTYKKWIIFKRYFFHWNEYVFVGANQAIQIVADCKYHHN